MKTDMKKGWEVKSLGDLADIKGGKRVPKGYRLETEESDYPYIRVTDFNDEGSVDLKDIHYVSKVVYEQIKNYTITTNDLYISIAGTIGKTGIIPIELNGANLTENACKLVFKIDVDPKFVYYFTKTDSFLKQVGLNTRIAAMPKLALTRLSTINFLFPKSLPEQQRIVSILDEAFAAIAVAKTNAEQNLKNAKELFESYLQGVFETKGEGWEVSCLKNEIDLITGFAFKSKDYTENKDDIILLRGDNIMQGNLRWEDVKRWKKSEYNEFKKYQLKVYDIVLAMDRPWVKAGLKCARLSKIDLPALLLQRTACLRNKSKIDNSFLYYLIKSKAFMNHLLDVQTGIGVPHISGQQILDFSFNKPILKNQQAIVQKLDALSAETKRLEAIYRQKSLDLEELQKSVLQKAFNGEL